MTQLLIKMPEKFEMDQTTFVKKYFNWNNNKIKFHVFIDDKKVGKLYLKSIGESFISFEFVENHIKVTDVVYNKIHQEFIMSMEPYRYCMVRYNKKRC